MILDPLSTNHKMSNISNHSSCANVYAYNDALIICSETLFQLKRPLPGGDDVVVQSTGDKSSDIRTII